MQTLAPHDIHIWLAFYQEIEEELPAMARLLSDAERQEMARYQLADDRRCYLVTRALVRTTLSRYVDVAPADWRFTVNAHGRPQIAGGAGLGDLRFNLSHTSGLIALTVGRGRDFGVDVEYLHARPASLRMAQRYFSAREAAALAQVPDAQRQERFLEYWTFKEAYIKARGHGLTFPLNAFAFDFDDDQAVRLSFDAAVNDDAGRWDLTQLRPTPEHILALCAARLAGDRPQVSSRRVVPTGEPTPLKAVVRRSSAPAPR